MAVPQKVETTVHQLPEGVDAKTFLALNHEVTEQFSSKPVASSQKVEPRPRQQLPPGVTAEDMKARSGEQP